MVAILIDEHGGRQRLTLGRFARRVDVARHLGDLYDALPKKRNAKG